MERRTFISYLGTFGAACLIMPELLSCDHRLNSKIKLQRLGANFERGHVLRTQQQEQRPKKNYKLNHIIIGGGMTGLSTAYHLKQSGSVDFLLLEMNNTIGGNSSYGKNQYSKFPLGAHYLTLPNPENRPLIAFLKKHQLITKEHNDGTIEFNERNLCFAPDERLLYRGQFQEGLVPTYGLDANKSKEINRFFQLMEEYKNKISRTQKPNFSIPLSYCEIEAEQLELDQITFKQFIDDHGFESEELLWFLDYCSRDDFGAGFDKISAWAGVNYFAGRRANPSNTIPSNVLTWPEGNGYLAELLRKEIKSQIQTDLLITKIDEKEDKVIVKGIDFKNNLDVEIEAQKVVIATPSYVTKHILHSPFWESSFFNAYKHHPWLVSAVVLSDIPSANGLELAWDNVKYGTKGLGYIHDQHQNLNQFESKHVISVYLTFDKQDPKTEREELYKKTDEELAQFVLNELKAMHPDIEKSVLSISFQVWGHGMVSTYPGSLTQHIDFKQRNSQSKRVHLAHTDYAGYSVFEEAFQMGIEAANFILTKDTNS